MLATRMNDLGTETAFEVFAQAKTLEAQGKDVIHLEIGEPDFETPSHIIEACQNAIQNNMTHYVPTPGIQEVRESIAKNISTTRNINVDWQNIVVTPGAKPIMFFTLLAIAEPGTEIIYPNPGFPIYESMINFCQATAIPMKLDPNNGYHPDLDDLETKINDKTRLIILNSPGNPTGGTINQTELQKIVELIEKYPNIYILSDEIYKDILYNDKHISITSFKNMLEKTIILDGLSKSYAMTGWRLGYGLFPETLTPHAIKLAVNSVSCATAFAQAAIPAALEGPQDELILMKKEFQTRRDLIVKGLNNIPGIYCPTPEGAFYAFPNIKETGLTSQKFEQDLLNKYGVALLAGTSFGKYGEGFVRISYANSQENINKALERLADFVKQI